MLRLIRICVDCKKERQKSRESHEYSLLARSTFRTLIIEWNRLEKISKPRESHGYYVNQPIYFFYPPIAYDMLV